MNKRFANQTFFGFGLFLTGIIMLVLSIKKDFFIPIGAFIAIPLVIGSVVLTFSSLYKALKWTSIAEFAAVYLFLLDRLSYPYINLFLFASIIAALLYINGRKLLSEIFTENDEPFKRKRTLYDFLMRNSNEKSFRCKLNSAKLDGLNEKYIVAYTKSGSSFQIIKCKNSFYVRRVSVNGKSIQVDRFISDYEFAEQASSKKRKSDYRIQFSDIKKAAFSPRTFFSLEYPCSGILKLWIGTDIKEFYVLFSSDTDKISSFFEDVIKCFVFEKRIKLYDLIKRFYAKEEKRTVIMQILKNLMYISNGWFILNPSYLAVTDAVFGVAALIIPLLIYIVYLSDSDTFSIKSIKGTNKNNVSVPLILVGLIQSLWVVQIEFVSISDFIKPFIIVSVILIAAFFIFSKEYIQFPSSTLSAVIILICFSFSSIGIIDKIFDFKEPVSYETQIIEKTSTYHTKTGYSYDIHLSLQNGEHTSIDVGKEMYNSLNEDDYVYVYEYGGFLDIPYIEISYSG